MSAYGVGSHRHQPEIQRNCQEICGESCGVIFTPHLVPMSRGIISTIYVPLTEKGRNLATGTAIPLTDVIRELYKDFYKDEPFVRVLEAGKNPTTKNVRYSNYCDMQVYVVHDGKMLQIVSVLDNMIKGASGQAVQHMNLMYGFKETTGIDMIPAAF